MSIFTTPDSRFQRVERQLATELDGETVILSIENGQYYKLDATGSMIWNLLEQPVTIDKLISELTEAFEVEPDECRTDTLSFLQELEAEGLITASS